MGVDLLVTYKGKTIADLGRKHLYTFDFAGGIPKSYEEIEEELSSVRKQTMADVATRIGILSTLDKDEYLEMVMELVDDIKDTLEYFEEECVRAGRIMTLIELEDDFNKEIEVIDEIDLESKEKEEGAAWKRLDEYLAECEEEGIYDAVEHQTSEVDLEWEKKEGEYLDRQNYN